MQISNEKPDENQIIVLLQELQPRPSSHFYHRMESAPWIIPKVWYRNWIPFSGLLSPRFQMRVIAITIVIIFVIITGVFAVPNIQVIAKQIAQYFLPAQSDQISLTLTSSPTGDPLFLDSPENFTLSLTEARDLAGFSPKEILLPLYGLNFTGAHYDSELQSVTLRYVGDSFLLLLTQRRIGEIEEYSSIGASAPVEIVPVRGVEGEYVAGGWRFISDGENPSFTVIPSNEVDIGVVWDPEIPQRILRWHEDDFLYEILLNGSHSLVKSDLLIIAAQIK